VRIEEEDGEGTQPETTPERRLASLSDRERERSERERNRGDERQEAEHERATEEGQTREQREPAIRPKRSKERFERQRERDTDGGEEQAIGELGVAREERQGRPDGVIEDVLTVNRVEGVCGGEGRIAPMAERRHHRGMLGRVGEREVARRDDRNDERRDGCRERRAMKPQLR
jgi:hypothetical protein